MEYADAVAAMFNPTPEGTIAQPTIDASPARTFRDAIEPLAMHAVWSATTNERLASLGLNFFSGYAWGRAAALGEPTASVVVSAFAVFEPSMIGGVYEEGRNTCDRATLLEARTESTVASLAAVLAEGGFGSLDGVDVAARALRGAVQAADGTGRPLFSGLLDRPWPDSPLGQVWHACELAREHRGDSHIAVCVGRGLGPIEMNVLTELWVGMPFGTYSASRGWTPEQLAESAEALRSQGLMEGDGLSDAGQAFRTEIETETDALEQPIIDALGSDHDEVVGLLSRWSEACIAGAAFPPDVYKRAAG